MKMVTFVASLLNNHKIEYYLYTSKGNRFTANDFNDANNLNAEEGAKKLSKIVKQHINDF